MDVQSDAVPISFEVGLGDLGMQWLSSTTRHCHIFVGKMDDEGQWDQSQLDHLTIEVDPEDEFEWTDEALELVRSHASATVIHVGSEGSSLTICEVVCAHALWLSPGCRIIANE